MDWRGFFKEIFYFENGNIKSQNELLLLICLALGTFVGAILKLDFRLKRLGDNLDQKFKGKRFSEGFIASSMVFLTGAMAIVGSIRSGLGDPELLYLKAAIDGITAIILASTLGYGVLFSATGILIYQGGITLFTIRMGPFLSQPFISAFSLIGYAILISIGINFIFKDKIKVINQIPALGLCIIYFIFLEFFGK